MVPRQLLGGIAARRHRDCPRADRASAGDVRGRVADDVDAIARNVESEILVCAPLRESRQLSARVVIGAEGAHLEAIEIDAGRAQLDRGALAQVAGEQAEDDVVPRLECVEQLAHSVEHVRARSPGELALEAAQVMLHERIDALVDGLIGVPARSHEIAHDLRIGLSVVVIVLGTRAAEYVRERLRHRAAAGAIAPEDGSIDIEQYELHFRRVRHVCVRVTPARIVTAPTPCSGVGCSCIQIHAAISANTGSKCR